MRTRVGLVETTDPLTYRVELGDDANAGVVQYHVGDRLYYGTVWNGTKYIRVRAGSIEEARNQIRGQVDNGR